MSGRHLSNGCVRCCLVVQRHAGQQARTPRACRTRRAAVLHALPPCARREACGRTGGSRPWSQMRPVVEVAAPAIHQRRREALGLAQERRHHAGLVPSGLPQRQRPHRGCGRGPWPSRAGSPTDTPNARPTGGRSAPCRRARPWSRGASSMAMMSSARCLGEREAAWHERGGMHIRTRRRGRAVARPVLATGTGQGRYRISGASGLRIPKPLRRRWPRRCRRPSCRR